MITERHFFTKVTLNAFSTAMLLFSCFDRIPYFISYFYDNSAMHIRKLRYVKVVRARSSKKRVGE